MWLGMPAIAEAESAHALSTSAYFAYLPYLLSSAISRSRDLDVSVHLFVVVVLQPVPMLARSMCDLSAFFGDGMIMILKSLKGSRETYSS